MNEIVELIYSLFGRFGYGALFFGVMTMYDASRRNGWIVCDPH